MSSIFGSFVPPDQSLSTTSSPEFAGLTVDGFEVITVEGNKNLDTTLTTTQTVFTLDQELTTKKYVDDAVGVIPSLTDLETKTQNIDLATIPNETYFNGNIGTFSVDTSNIGAPSFRFNGYFNNLAVKGTTTYGSLARTSGNILPLVNLTNDIGSTLLRYDAIYTGNVNTNTLGVNTSMTCPQINGNISIGGGDFKPVVDNGSSLGTALLRFNNIFGNTITGNSIVKVGGLSTDFLKADGSSDSNSYLTSGSTAITDLQDKTQNQTAIAGTTTFSENTILNLTNPADQLLVKNDLLQTLFQLNKTQCVISSNLTACYIQPQIYTNNIEATQFKKTGGLSTEFLKADGTLDSSAYLTSGDISGILTNATLFENTTFDLTNPTDEIVVKNDLAQTIFQLNKTQTAFPLTGGPVYIQPILYTNNIEGSQFKKVGALSTDFLKGDGTIDSNKYKKTYFSQIVDKTIANTIVQTSLFSTGVGSLSIPANFIVEGDTMKIRLSGYMDTSGTPNLTLRLKFGATTIITSVIAMTGVPPLSSFFLEYFICFRSTASVVVTGIFQYSDTSTVHIEPLVLTSPVVVNTTINSLIDVTAQYSSADVNNNITTQIAVVSSEY